MDTIGFQCISLNLDITLPLKCECEIAKYYKESAGLIMPRKPNLLMTRVRSLTPKGVTHEAIYLGCLEGTQPVSDSAAGTTECLR